MGFFANLFKKEAGEAAQEALGSAGQLIEKTANAIRGRDPEIEKALLEAGTQIAVAQAEIAKTEAQSGRFFVAGARPFILWVCGIALAYNFLLSPLLSQLAKLPMPEIDMGPLMTLLFGMLGLAGMRTYEKYKGIQDKH